MRIVIGLLCMTGVLRAATAPTMVDQWFSTTPGVGVRGTIVATPANGGDTLGYAIIRGPFYGTIILDSATGGFSYTPAPSAVAVTEPLGVRVTDQTAASATATINIRISGPDDDRPFITSRPLSEYLFVGQTWTYRMTVDSSRLDQVNQLLDYSLEQSPSGALILPVTGNQVDIQFSPSVGQVGINHFMIKVVDRVTRACDIQQVAVVVEDFSASN